MEDEDNSVTMVDVLKEQEAFEEDAKAVLGASDDKNCTYSLGYIKRQALYACLTCCPESLNDPSSRAGLCLACSLACHENHNLIELYTKRNFKCDCGGPKFGTNSCTFNGKKCDNNIQNNYNQNFAGLYCICHRPYPDNDDTIEDEMIQCIVCEDWFHSRHLDAKLPPMDQFSEMICGNCMNKNEFLNLYTCYEVKCNSDSDQSLDVTGTENNESIIEQPKTMDIDVVGSSETSELKNDNDTNVSKLDKDNIESNDFQNSVTISENLVSDQSDGKIATIDNKTENTDKNHIEKGEEPESNNLETNVLEVTEESSSKENMKYGDNNDSLKKLNHEEGMNVDNEKLQDNNEVIQDGKNIELDDKKGEVESDVSHKNIEDDTEESNKDLNKSEVLDNNDSLKVLEQVEGMDVDPEKMHDSKDAIHEEKSVIDTDLNDERKEELENVSEKNVQDDPKKSDTKNDLNKIEILNKENVQNGDDNDIVRHVEAMDVDPETLKDSTEVLQEEENKTDNDVASPKITITVNVESETETAHQFVKKDESTCIISENIEGEIKATLQPVQDSDSSCIISENIGLKSDTSEPQNQETNSSVIAQNTPSQSEKSINDNSLLPIDNLKDNVEKIEHPSEISLKSIEKENDVMAILNTESDLPMETEENSETSNTELSVQEANIECLDTKDLPMETEKNTETPNTEICVQEANIECLDAKDLPVETEKNTETSNTELNVQDGNIKCLNTKEDLPMETEKNTETSNTELNVQDGNIKCLNTKEDLPMETEKNTETSNTELNVQDANIKCLNTKEDLPMETEKNTETPNTELCVQEANIKCLDTKETAEKLVENETTVKTDFDNADENNISKHGEERAGSTSDMQSTVIENNKGFAATKLDTLMDTDESLCNAAVSSNECSKTDEVITNDEILQTEKFPKECTKTNDDQESSKPDDTDSDEVSKTNQMISNNDCLTTDNKECSEFNLIHPIKDVSKNDTTINEDQQPTQVCSVEEKITVEQSQTCDNSKLDPSETCSTNSHSVDIPICKKYPDMHNSNEHGENIEMTDLNKCNESLLNLLPDSGDSCINEENEKTCEIPLSKNDLIPLAGDKMATDTTDLEEVQVSKSNTECKSQDEVLENGAVNEPCKVNEPSTGNDSESNVISETENLNIKKRKFESDNISDEISQTKKVKQEMTVKECIKPVFSQNVKRNGAAFWPSDWRSKLCSCESCLYMYNERNVSFLLDPEDTVSAYEYLGKIKTEASSSQYEKGMEALSSLGHIQQINAITEYNKMKEKLLEFLKTFKDKKEIVKEEDIKGFFAGMKPKREPDGVYFCR